MSEPSSGVPGEIADAEVEAPTTDEPTTVELELDEDKLEAWDDVKADYQVDPGGAPVPNSMDQAAVTPADDNEGADEGADDATGGDEDDDSA